MFAVMKLQLLRLLLVGKVRLLPPSITQAFSVELKRPFSCLKLLSNPLITQLIVALLELLLILKLLMSRVTSVRVVRVLLAMISHLY